MTTLHFIRPIWLLGTIPLILYLIWIITKRRQENPWRTVCDAHLLPVLLQHSKNAQQYIFHGILALFFLGVTFTLAGPSWDKMKMPVYRDVASMMLVLDVSTTMQSIDIKPDRLARAKFKIRDLIQASQNTQMGLVVFSGEGFVASPLSQDANTLLSLLDELHPEMMPLGGSDPGQGLSRALTLLTQTQSTMGAQRIEHGHFILITGSAPTASSWIAAKAIRAAGHSLDILAMLEPNADTQNTLSALQELAKVGGGLFYQFTADDTDIHNILSNHMARKIIHDQNVESANLWHDRGPWFCLLLLPLVLLILRNIV